MQVSEKELQRLYLMQIEEKNFLLSAIKMQVVTINKLHSKNYENKKKAQHYEIGCGVLFFICLISNLAWLNTFLGA